MQEDQPPPQCHISTLIEVGSLWPQGEGPENHRHKPRIPKPVPPTILIHFLQSNKNKSLFILRFIGHLCYLPLNVSWYLTLRFLACKHKLTYLTVPRMISGLWMDVMHYVAICEFGGWVVKNLPASAGNTGEAGSILGWKRSPGGGNGNPLQHSCLENAMDRGAWWVTAWGVTKNWTWLSTQWYWLWVG